MLLRALFLMAFSVFLVLITFLVWDNAPNHADLYQSRALPASPFLSSIVIPPILGGIHSFIKKNIFLNSNDDEEGGSQKSKSIHSAEDMVDFFNFAHMTPLMQDGKNESMCLWSHTLYYTKFNWQVYSLNQWYHPDTFLPLLEQLIQYTPSHSTFFILAKNMNPRAYDICKRVYNKKCSAQVLMDIDKHIRGVAHTKLPFSKGRFLPFVEPEFNYLDLPLILLNQFKKAHLLARHHLEQLFMDLLDLNTSSEPISIQLQMLIYVGIYMVMLSCLGFMYTCLRWQCIFMIRFIVLPLIQLLICLGYWVWPSIKPVVEFLALIVTPPFSPLIILFTMWKRKLSPFTSSKLVPLLTRLKSKFFFFRRFSFRLNWFTRRSQTEHDANEERKQSNEKRLSKTDSAFLDSSEESQSSLTKEEELKKRQAVKYGCVNGEFQRKDIPNYIESDFSGLYQYGFQLLLGNLDYSHLHSCTIRYFKQHESFLNTNYYIVPLNPKLERLEARGCAVYRVAEIRTNRHYIAHMYPDAYAGFFGCWENVRYEPKRALKTSDVILANRAMIQITEDYQINFQTLVQSFKDVDAKPDRNPILREGFIWRLLYNVLPAMEIALLRRCFYGHLEIVFLEKEGFLVRGIRKLCEVGENQNCKLVDSLNQLILTLLDDLSTLKQRGYSTLLFDLLTYLRQYENQYRTVVVAWVISKFVEQYMYEYRLKSTVQQQMDFDFDTFIMPSLESIIHRYHLERLTKNDEWQPAEPDVQVFPVEVFPHQLLSPICKEKTLKLEDFNTTTVTEKSSVHQPEEKEGKEVVVHQPHTLSDSSASPVASSSSITSLSPRSRPKPRPSLQS